MKPLLNSGYRYQDARPFTYEKISPGDTKYASVPIMGKPPTPPPTENVVPPGEPADKAEEGTQDGGKGGEPAAANDVTPESTGLLSLSPFKLTFAKSIAH